VTAICFDRPWMCKRSRSRRHSRGGETAARHALTDTVAVSRPVAAPSDVIYGTSIPLGPCSAWPPLTGRTAPTGRLFAQPLPAGHLSAPLAVGVSSYTILQVDTTMAAAQR